MRHAITAALDAKRDGGVAIGAILVDESTGRIIARGESLVGPTHDPTAHAEIRCIRQATRRLGRDDLFGLTLYSTLEPCHMCLGAAAWARIAQVYFGARRRDVDASLFDTREQVSDEQEAARMNLREQIRMHAYGGVLERECAALLNGYHEKFKHS